jgi:hypothetical protein
MGRVQFSASFEQFIVQTKDKSKVSKYLHNYIAGDKDVVCRNITAEKINYLTLRKNGTISYLPYGRELKKTVAGEWSRDGHQEGKPAKTITNIMRNAMIRSLTNRDLEIFSNLYLGQATDLYTIHEARGKKIAEVYNMPSNFGSCMLGRSNTNKINFYANNPNQIGLLYVVANDICQSRALVWTDNEGRRVVDRVYGGEEFITMMLDYARENGMYKKRDDCSGGGNIFISPEGGEEHIYFNIELECDEQGCYPFVDTFCYMNGMTLSNSGADAEKKLQCTDGDFESLTGVAGHGAK